MASCCVAFGPNSGYFLSSAHNRSINNVPPRILSLFTTEPKANYVHDIALGPDGSHAIIFADASGIKIRHSGLPPELQKWLLTASGTAVQAARDLGSMRITLGARGAYFAFDKNGAAWSNLPPGLDKAVNERRDGNGSFKEGAFPQSVALGPEGTYVMTTVGGGGSWSLNGSCRGLSQFLKDRENLIGVYIALSPCHWGVYILVTATGDCLGAVPDQVIPAFDIFARDWRSSIQTMFAEQNYHEDLAHAEQQRQADLAYAEQTRLADVALAEKMRLLEVARAEQAWKDEPPPALLDRKSVPSPVSRPSETESPPALPTRKSVSSPVADMSQTDIPPPLLPGRKSVSSPVTQSPQADIPSALLPGRKSISSPATQPPETDSPPALPTRKSVSSPAAQSPQINTPRAPQLTQTSPSPAPQPPQPTQTTTSPAPQTITPRAPQPSAADLAAQREASKARHAQYVQTAVTVGKVAVKGLGLLNTVLNIANGNVGGGGGGGGGGTVWVPDISGGVDAVSNTFWTPVQGAAGDGIQ